MPLHIVMLCNKLAIMSLAKLHPGPDSRQISFHWAVAHALVEFAPLRLGPCKVFES